MMRNTLLRRDRRTIKIKMQTFCSNVNSCVFFTFLTGINIKRGMSSEICHLQSDEWRPLLRRRGRLVTDPEGTFPNKKHVGKRDIALLQDTLLE